MQGEQGSGHGTKLPRGFVLDDLRLTHPGRQTTRLTFHSQEFQNHPPLAASPALRIGGWLQLLPKTKLLFTTQSGHSAVAADAVIEDSLDKSESSSTTTILKTTNATLMDTHTWNDFLQFMAIHFPLQR